jgi:hypothetical protein
MITTEFHQSVDISNGSFAAYKTSIGAPCSAHSSLISNIFANYSETLYGRVLKLKQEI